VKPNPKIAWLVSTSATLGFTCLGGFIILLFNGEMMWAGVMLLSSYIHLVSAWSLTHRPIDEEDEP
jgi:hypothetical protein